MRHRATPQFSQRDAVLSAMQCAPPSGSFVFSRSNNPPGLCKCVSPAPWKMPRLGGHVGQFCPERLHCWKKKKKTTDLHLQILLFFLLFPKINPFRYSGPEPLELPFQHPLAGDLPSPRVFFFFSFRAEKYSFGLAFMLRTLLQLRQSSAHSSFSHYEDPQPWSLSLLLFFLSVRFFFLGLGLIFGDGRAPRFLDTLRVHVDSV